ncbi:MULTISPECIES: LysR family transcriptional regulator [unclassified Sinorhizobium]|uniref:LysR family transcriptional regulator n=1 Tax=unclassified Sinorhizobium TaxID=2613772 RepID=UPI0024C27FC0|nr:MULTISPECIES: LysR family transcriptional regulator [unclassified Sinorhizobium]MDK1373482.1 LysR family transcriptional regulator [Sinorhizobium sp. 6-70]MDK1479717.1 LysR family transcriptional regulator [Sinorhizobium sp. 6-117]
MLDLNDIVVFARVVEAGSFTAAARQLGMPKTTVSRRIAALEREVGVRLLQRTTRSLNMTDAGRLYYEQSSQALRTIEEANLRLAEARAEPSGTIRISAPVGFGGHFLTRAVVDFLAIYPKTKVELRLTDDNLNLVEHGIDLAFRTGILADSTLIARKLGSTHRLLCASPNYVARSGVPDGPADLARHECVIAGPSAASAHWLLDGPHGQETVTVAGRFAANEMQAVVAAAIAGYGIAQVPQGMAEALVTEGRLRRVLHDYTTPAGGLYVLYPSSRHLSPLVKAFIELAAERWSAARAGETDKAVAVFT